MPRQLTQRAFLRLLVFWSCCASRSDCCCCDCSCLVSVVVTVVVVVTTVSVVVVVTVDFPGFLVFLGSQDSSEYICRFFKCTGSSRKLQRIIYPGQRKLRTSQDSYCKYCIDVVYMLLLLPLSLSPSQSFSLNIYIYVYIYVYMYTICHICTV